MRALWLASLGVLLLSHPTGYGQTAKPTRAKLCLACVHADMSFLASDTLRGRGSATRDEHLAAEYAATQFESFGLAPGGDQGSFFQKVRLPNPLPAKTMNALAGLETVPRTETWNVVAILRGSDPVASKDAILLTAHLDHLGIGPAKNGDRIYNGADDDASGTTAVLELARLLAASPHSPRTIIFVLFGSEEIGMFGNAYFLDHSPVPLDHIVANLEFEMIGRRDPALPRDGLWLTGFARSDLGRELVRHGANLVEDPHPREKFFQRSDNYSLARRGVIAHTVSSFGLHADYHQPSDELRTIDFTHLTTAIDGMAGPIQWLAGTRWKPQWAPNGKP